MDKTEIEKTVEAALRQIMLQEKEMSDHADKEAGSHVCMCNGRHMTLRLAKALIERVEARAQEMCLKVVIAVADQSARPVAIHCMDGAYIASFDIAVNKAYTSAGLKMSTGTVGELSQPGAPLYGIQHTNAGKIVIFGGGEPLCADGVVIGALGVSGGTLEQDTALAAYGKEIFKEVVVCL